MYRIGIIDSNVNSIANLFQNIINIMYKIHKGIQLDEDDEYFLEENYCNIFGEYNDNIHEIFKSLDTWVDDIERSR